MKRMILAIMVMGLMAMSPVSLAAPPGTMNYQGRLTDSAGKAVNGEVDITFILYTTATGASNVWSEMGNNTTGGNNTANGTWALFRNTTGSQNTATGDVALFANTTGTWNTANGAQALWRNTTGGDNTVIGSSTLRENTTGSKNTATGSVALFSNTTGIHNTAAGVWALGHNTTGYDNTATGAFALQSITTGWSNVANGTWTMNEITTGIQNTATGAAALKNNTTGTKNTALGTNSGLNNTVGSGNVFLGFQAGINERGSNSLYISNNATTPLIYGQFAPVSANNKLGIGTATVAAGDAINTWTGTHLTKGGVWTNASSRALKEHIRPVAAEQAMQALDGLQPVLYNYRNSTDEEYAGFIAEDVPELVAMNDRKSLAAMDIVAVLTKVVKEQQAQLVAQNKRVEELAARVEMLTRAMAAGQVAQAETGR